MARTGTSKRSSAKKSSPRGASAKKPTKKKNAKKNAKKNTAKGAQGARSGAPRSAPRSKVTKKARVVAPAAPPPNPRAKALAHRMADLLLDKKANDVVILDVRGKTSYADYVVIASGDSERQVTAMADHVAQTLKNQGHTPIGREGEQTGQWVLLDYGEVIAHLFFTEARTFYDLEGLWADAPKEKVA